MLIINKIFNLVAMALHSKYISSILFTRIASIVFIYAGALSLNALYIQSIGSGIGIYRGLQITMLTTDNSSIILTSVIGLIQFITRIQIVFSLINLYQKKW